MSNKQTAHRELVPILKFAPRGGAQQLTQEAIHAFQTSIYAHYESHGRQLPWRETQDPYRILVSEIMLQQTQVPRVLQKYEEFLRAFPDFRSLAQASVQELLKVWQGLGYNRRALALRKTAELVVSQYRGVLPADPEELRKLPGIGPYTAAAIAAFAFNLPAAFIETNIRTVFIHCFFHDQTAVKDREILHLVEQTLDTANPRQWYYALMDYGAMLKQRYHNPNRRSAQYQKQTPFKGSNRELRGMILRALTAHVELSETELVATLNADPERVTYALKQLINEGFISRDEQSFRIV
jgi:A/G-specific adenine glycosylase